MILRPPDSNCHVQPSAAICKLPFAARSVRMDGKERRGRTAPPCLYRSAVSIALTMELLGGVGTSNHRGVISGALQIAVAGIVLHAVTSALFSTWMLPLATSLVTEVTPVLLVTWILPFVVSPEIVVVARLLWTRMLPPTVSLPQLGPPMAIATALPCTCRLPFTLVLKT